MAKIVVDISPMGEVKMEGHGFTGTVCKDTMQRYQEMLGTQKSQQDHTIVDDTEIRVGAR